MLNVFYRGLNKSEFEQNEKLQEIVEKYDTKLQEKDKNIVKVRLTVYKLSLILECRVYSKINGTTKCVNITTFGLLFLGLI